MVAVMQEPKRRVTVTLDLGADSMEEAVEMLGQVAYDAGTVLEDCVHSGPSVSYVLRVHENPDQTHEKYHAELDAYLERLRNPADPFAGRQPGNE